MRRQTLGLSELVLGKEHQWSLGLGLGLGFDGLLQKAGLVLGLPMGLDKPITKCGNCERGEPREFKYW
jgi:hypothetical protein